MKLRQKNKNSIKYLTRRVLKKKLKESNTNLETGLQKIKSLELRVKARDMRLVTLSQINSDLMKVNIELKKRPRMLNLFKKIAMLAATRSWHLQKLL